MRALTVVLPVLCILAIAYRYYSGFIARRVSDRRGLREQASRLIVGVAQSGIKW